MLDKLESVNGGLHTIFILLYAFLLIKVSLQLTVESLICIGVLLRLGLRLGVLVTIENS